MVQKILGAQRDFSYGQVDVALKRQDDHPARKAGMRQMVNARILNSLSFQNRPGRSALYPISNNCTRIEEFSLTSGVINKIAFGPARIQIINAAGAVVQSFTTQGGGGALPWTAFNLNQIVWALFRNSIYVTFAGMKPQVINFDGVSWTIADYAELVNGNQKRTPFYRLSPQNIAIQPTDRTGAIQVVASQALWTPSHVGTRIRFVDRQILITGYNSSTSVNATVQETLPGAQTLIFGSDPALVFSVGDVVVGALSAARGIVTNINVGLNSFDVQLITNNTTDLGVNGPHAFVVETIAGPGGSLASTGGSAIANPLPVTTWDEEVMNAMRGYPASCFSDQFRLGFCDFPSLPNGIGWSAINSPGDMYANDVSSPSNSIFELCPDKVRVFYVDLPPLKWSSLKYDFRMEDEIDGEEEAYG